MIKNKRQMSPTLAGIRDDHVERYRFAAREINRRGLVNVMDVGCGCGYGSYIMAQSELKVDAFDLDPDAIAYGENHYNHPLITRSGLAVVDFKEFFDSALAMFEIIEHVREAPVFLSHASKFCRLLILSVPNENAVPFGPGSHPQHYRHYTPEEICEELDNAGWRPVFEGSQKGKRGKEAEIIETDLSGRTLVVVAEPKR